MKKHSKKRFLNWAAAHGLGLDERYPGSAILTFKPDPDLARFWEIPPEPGRRPHFLSLMLELMGEWRSCFAWRHMGKWPSKTDLERPNEMVERQIYDGVGLPLGTTHIVEFDKSDTDRLVTLLFATTVFGCTVYEDLYVVPDHAQYIMETDHHDAVHVSFRDDERLQHFITGMREQKFYLPDDVPDATFKVPGWTKR